jgi:micrococcal nuclease
MSGLSKKFEYWYQAEVVSNHDGDTITLKIDLGRRCWTEDSIRLYRINAPELSQAGGKEARDYLRGLIPAGTPVRIQTFKNQEDKYGRWLGDVWAENKTTGEMYCLNDHLVETGHAKYLAK